MLVPRPVNDMISGGDTAVKRQPLRQRSSCGSVPPVAPLAHSGSLIHNWIKNRHTARPCRQCLSAAYILAETVTSAQQKCHRPDQRPCSLVDNWPCSRREVQPCFQSSPTACTFPKPVTTAQPRRPGSDQRPASLVSE